jgi:hypothetical protein
MKKNRLAEPFQLSASGLAAPMLFFSALTVGVLQSCNFEKGDGKKI